MGNPDGHPDAETHFKYIVATSAAHQGDLAMAGCLPLHALTHVPSDGGRVEVTSPAFEGKTRIQCHRLVYEALEHELKNGVHALSLRTKAA